MSKQANTAVIGSFVLGGLVLLIAGLLIFGGGKFFTKTSKHVLFFDGSVKGLTVGAPVDFKGVRIGSVTDINLLFDPRDLSFKIMVQINTEPERITPTQVAGDEAKALDKYIGVKMIDLLIEKGLRAQLGMQSLVTGQLYVNLDFFPDKPARIVGIQNMYAEIPTIPSSLEQLSKTVERLPLEEIADKFVASLEGIERFINSPDSQQILASLNATAKDAQRLLKNINDRVEPISGNLEETLKEARSLLANIDSQVRPLSKDAGEAVREIKALAKNLDSRLATIASSLEGTIKATQATLVKAESALTTMEGAVGENSDVRYELASTLKELSSTARSMRFLADYLERHPESLIRGKKQ